MFCLINKLIFSFRNARTSMRLWASGWSSRDVQFAPVHSGLFYFVSRGSGAKYSESDSYLPVQWGTRLRRRAQMPVFVCFCSTAELSARGRTFARNNSFGRGEQSHLGLVVLGPLILEGTLEDLVFIGCLRAPEPSIARRHGLGWLMIVPWPFVLGPALPRGNLGGHLFSRAGPFRCAAA